ncbi:rod shape-determining protein MreD [Tindallia californiensis]|uniref:Rod shape-determining protein MreD n=1 Tax=Tindallia californiensis TaxID=159292 RepID=A0A1H3NBR8_9FIRM|nr:rod shape-determining protein MreD [Tindallia californiensis]SDY86318.1 rod shape-determining protein MreD [Tindallia californiensis]
MRKIFLSLFFFSSIVLESTFFSYIQILGVVPNITMILVICFALYYEEKNGAIIGFSAGIIKDIIIGRLVGISALTFMAIGFLVGYYNRKVFAENITTPFVLTVLCTLLHESIMLMVLFLGGHPMQFGMIINRVYLYQTLLNALVAIPIYVMISQVLNSHFLRKSY